MADVAHIDPNEGVPNRDMPRPGTMVGRWEIVALLGEGGYGLVFEAADPSDPEVRVALKWVPLKRHRDKRIAQRTIVEVHSLQKIDHINVVRYIDAGLESEAIWCAMELLRGKTIHDLGQLTLEHALDLGRQCASGLQAAHTAGVLHRDIKPSNIFWTLAGTAKVLDFGASRLMEKGIGTTNLIGTPLYMAPAYLTEGKPDLRHDLYSLCMLVYVCAAGRHPHVKPLENPTELTSGAVIQRIINNPVPPLSEAIPGCPTRVSALLHRGLQKDPSRGFTSAEELEAEFATCLRELRRMSFPADPELQARIHETIHQRSPSPESADPHATTTPAPVPSAPQPAPPPAPQPAPPQPAPPQPAPPQPAPPQPAPPPAPLAPTDDPHGATLPDSPHALVAAPPPRAAIRATQPLPEAAAVSHRTAGGTERMVPVPEEALAYTRGRSGTHLKPQHSEPQHSEPQHSEPQHSEPQHSEPQHSELQAADDTLAAVLASFAAAEEPHHNEFSLAPIPGLEWGVPSNGWHWSAHEEGVVLGCYAGASIAFTSLRVVGGPEDEPAATKVVHQLRAVTSATLLGGSSTVGQLPLPRITLGTVASAATRRGVDGWEIFLTSTPQSKGDHAVCGVLFVPRFDPDAQRLLATTLSGMQPFTRTAALATATAAAQAAPAATPPQAGPASTKRTPTQAAATPAAAARAHASNPTMAEPPVNDANRVAAPAHAAPLVPAPPPRGTPSAAHRAAGDPPPIRLSEGAFLLGVPALVGVLHSFAALPWIVVALTHVGVLVAFAAAIFKNWVRDDYRLILVLVALAAEAAFLVWLR